MIVNVTGSMWAALALAAGLVLWTQPMHGQTVLKQQGGGELRYRGDTIWRERDTTVMRMVYKGDTATRTFFIDGKEIAHTVSLLMGDVARMISARSANGVAQEPAAVGRIVPVMAFMSERMMLEQAISSNAMSERMASIGSSMPSWEAPLSPTEVQTYGFSPNTRIVQHRDTVRYVRGCAAAPPIDTTVYVMFATDSVQRLSPSPRTFGRHMASAVRGDMGSILLQQRVAQARTAPVGIPGPRRWPCDIRP